MRGWSRELWTYIKLIAGKWYILAIAALDAFGVVAAFANLNLQIPAIVYWGAAVVGLVWAGFDIYQDQQRRLAKHDPANVVNLEARVAIELVEGNEYAYSLDIDEAYELALKEETNIEHALSQFDPKKVPSGPENTSTSKSGDEASTIERLENTLRIVRNKIKLHAPEHISPRGRLTIHLRISNTGDLDTQILNVEVRFHSESQVWSFIRTTVTDLMGEELHYPVQLPCKAVTLCNVMSEVPPAVIWTNAQFAARLAEMTTRAASEVKVRVSVEVFTTRRERRQFSNEFTISVRPLKDQYLARWEALGYTNLVQIARGEE